MKKTGLKFGASILILAMILAMLLAACTGQNADQPANSTEDEKTPTFLATVLELTDTTALVEPLEGETERTSCDRISLSIKDLEPIGIRVGDIVNIQYDGQIMESYPAQIRATDWELANDLRPLEYTEQFMDKAMAEKYNDDLLSDIVITKIYSNCFFATRVIPSPIEVKINGALSEDWCVGDQVYVTCENTYYDAVNHRIEADLLTVTESDFELQPNVAYKPVIYLYPEEQTWVNVELTLDGELTCTYPAYKKGWTMTAYPDGTLVDDAGQTYNYLYWEGETRTTWDMSQGFCVKGADTAAFLEDALEKLGLNRREANEFIVYWLPLMEENPYNIISFQEDTYTSAAALAVTPTPDTVIRVFMAWQGVDAPVAITPQTLTAPERTGFTVVEWGGTEITE